MQLFSCFFKVCFNRVGQVGFSVVVLHVEKRGIALIADGTVDHVVVGTHRPVNVVVVFELVSRFLDGLLVFLVIEVSTIGSDDRQLAPAAADLRECELQIVKSFLGLRAGKLKFVGEVVCEQRDEPAQQGEYCEPHGNGCLPPTVGRRTEFI